MAEEEQNIQVVVDKLKLICFIPLQFDFFIVNTLNTFAS